MAKRGVSFSVNTEPTKEVVVGSLTKDISVEACIFDLIDNSIDAARDTIYAKFAVNDVAPELPASYAGYEIDIKIDGNLFSIQDDCGGIAIERLKTMALRFGERSAHRLGIGLFGVGLNRALFKLGRNSQLKTDTGSERAELTLNTDTYLNSIDWTLPAVSLPSTGSAGTLIEITELPGEISTYFADNDKMRILKEDIGRRYSRFLEKGLIIKVNDRPVISHEVIIRQDGPFAPENKYYKMPNGVIVHVEFGQHNDHRFSAESDYDKDNNKELTDEFGWSVFCNDRAILLNDKTWKTGWDTKFHSEFYGFVGFVRFISPESDKLPWNTTKTDVDLNNKAYQSALEDMRYFAQKWRKIAGEAKAVKKRGGVLNSAPAAQPATNPAAKGKAANTNAPAAATPPTIKLDHNQFVTILPPDIDEKLCFDKHLSLVHEAKRLELTDMNYTGLALIRMLFEVSVLKHAARHSYSDKLKDFSLARRRNGGTTITAAQEKSFVPSLDDMLAFLVNEPDIWGATTKHAHLKSSLNRMAKHKPLINGVLHNAFQQVNRSEAFQIRDEALPLLRHLIEN